MSRQSVVCMGTSERRGSSRGSVVFHLNGACFDLVETPLSYFSHGKKCLGWCARVQLVRFLELRNIILLKYKGNNFAQLITDMRKRHRKQLHVVEPCSIGSCLYTWAENNGGIATVAIIIRIA